MKRFLRPLDRAASFARRRPKTAIWILLFLGGTAFAIVRHYVVMYELVRRSAQGEPLSGVKDKPSQLLLWDVPGVVWHVKAHPDHSSYHLLMALHDQFPEGYRLISSDHKAAILCDALQHMSAFNEWGYLTEDDCREGELGQVLVETGQAALPYLEPVLDDHEPALLWGSHAATLSHAFNYRVADFAHRYICLIMDWHHVFHTDVKERDEEIERLKARIRALMQVQDGG